MDRDGAISQDARLLQMLEALLALEVSDLETAMEQAAQRLAEVLGADKVDVFLHDPATQAMVAVGTSDTPMGRKQRALGLDRLPIAEGGRTVEVFQTGRSYLSRRADLEQGEPPRMIEELGVRSSINVPLEVAGERRGVLLASSATPEFFSERDLRFLEAVARWVGLASQRAVQVERVASQAAAEGVRRAAHKALAAVEEDIEQLRFNRAVARIYELANALQAGLAEAKADFDATLRTALREGAEILVQLAAPMMPHAAEECWRALGRDTLLAETPWPEADRRLLVEDTVTLPVQVNGKKRAEIVVARDAGQQEIESAALAHEAVRRAMEGRAPKRVIVVPQRIVNVVG